MFSENFMRFLITYQSEEGQPVKEAKSTVLTKRPLMVDLIGIKYAAVPVKHSAK